MAVKLDVNCSSAYIRRVGRAATERQRRPAAENATNVSWGKRAETRRTSTAAGRVAILARGGGGVTVAVPSVRGARVEATRVMRDTRCGGSGQISAGNQELRLMGPW